MAIILAGYSPRVRLLGVSSVAGNQTVTKTTENAAAVMAAAGLSSIELCQGQAKPLLRSAVSRMKETHRAQPPIVCRRWRPTANIRMIMRPISCCHAVFWSAAAAVSGDSWRQRPGRAERRLHAAGASAAAVPACRDAHV